MESMFLTDEELTGLTSCKTNWAKVRWLTANEIPYIVRPDGSPAVSRSAYNLATFEREPVSPFPSAVEVMRIDRIPRSLCGIYFLWRMGEVVYVGMSRNALARIAQHLKSDKEFDSISLIESSLDTLKDLEAEMIARFDPIYNVMGRCVTVPEQLQEA
jgi:hypothetical protein